MSNNSSTGGYLGATTQALPGGLSLEDFIQTVIVGVSGYTNTLVRPKFQEAPPKNPVLSVDWIAFSVQTQAEDANAYVSKSNGSSSTLSRQYQLEVQCAFYGPNAEFNSSAFVDGFQIQQNLEALNLANMGFTGISTPVRMPDLINERWQDRWEVALTLAYKIVRTYSILPFASVQGSVHTVLEDDHQLDQPFEEDV